MLPLGQIRTHIPAARVENLDEVLNRLRTAEDDDEVSFLVVLVPAGDNTYTLKRLPI